MHAVDVRDKHVQHSNLVTERRAALFDDHCDLAILVQSLDRVVVAQLDDRAGWLLLLGGFSCAVVDTDNAVAELQLGVDVCLDVANRVRRKQKHMSVLSRSCAEVVDCDLELWRHFHVSVAFQPVGMSQVLGWILDRDLYRYLSVSLFGRHHIDRRTVERSCENSMIVTLLVVANFETPL